MTKKDIGEILSLVSKSVVMLIREFLSDFTAYVAWIYKKPVAMVFTAILVGWVGYLVHASSSIPTQLSENGRILVKIAQFDADFDQVQGVSDALNEYNTALTKATSYMSPIIHSRMYFQPFEPAIINEAKTLLEAARDKGSTCIVMLRASKLQTPSVQEAFKGLDIDLRNNEVIFAKLDRFFTLHSSTDIQELIKFRDEWNRDYDAMYENSKIVPQRAKNTGTVIEYIKKEFQNEALDGTARISSIKLQMLAAQVGYNYLILYVLVLALAFLRFSYKRGRRRWPMVRSILMKSAFGGNH